MFLFDNYSMELLVKNKKGKVTHILGLEAQLVVGLLLLLVGALGVLYVYLTDIFSAVIGKVG
jgi:hypothetical protein